MSNFWIVLLVILAVAAVVLAILYYQGQKLQKKQEEAQENLQAQSQRITMLVIDKKRMALKDASLPAAVMDNIPKRYRRAKVPIVKAKIGPQILTLIADEEVYDRIPVKASVKADISGIYITGINNYRKAPVPEPEKKGILGKIRQKASASMK